MVVQLWVDFPSSLLCDVLKPKLKDFRIESESDVLFCWLMQLELLFESFHFGFDTFREA